MRRSVAVALLLCALVLGLCAAAAPSAATRAAYFPLDSSTVALGPDRALTAVFDPSALVPGTRVLAGRPDSARLAAEQRAWLAEGRVPQLLDLEGSTMVADALLDLHVLSAPSGVAVAGRAPAWRYVWPRDSALVATALARTGHLADAERVLALLQRVQPEAGPFQARYRPDGTGVPDGRGAQVDTLGWVLWSSRQVALAWPASSRSSFVDRHRALLDRSVRASLALLDNPTALPPASPDYWERRERRLTLSTAALLHAGLVAAAPLYDLIGDPGQAALVRAAADRTAAAIRTAFAADGYPRSHGGPAASVDLGVAYLLPPFTDSAVPDVLQAWRGSAAWLARPAGGLAPGGSWRRDGVSWTTATSSDAVTAAAVGDRDRAVARLRWLDAHRTAAGSLPEKVLADGRPASVAPLAWAAASVVIAVDELQRDAG